MSVLVAFSVPRTRSKSTHTRNAHIEQIEREREFEADRIERHA